MLTTFPNAIINNLPDMTFIAGSYQELLFNITSTEGEPIDVTYFNITWAITPYNRKEHVTFSKNGEGANGFFIVYLFKDDTKNLMGKYNQIAKISVLPSFEYNIAQGILNIIPRIGVDNYE
jgi:hypothetical protein